MITKFDVGDRVRNDEMVAINTFVHMKRGRLGVIKEFKCDSVDGLVWYKVAFDSGNNAWMKESQLISDEDWIACEETYAKLGESIGILETYQGELETGCRTSSYTPKEIVDTLENVIWAAKGLMKIYDGEKED